MAVAFRSHTWQGSSWRALFVVWWSCEVKQEDDPFAASTVWFEDRHEPADLGKLTVAQTSVETNAAKDSHFPAELY